ncbi:GGDEF domain-containing protein [Sulfurimonas sp. HSL-1716]|uniref:GGDEF domain-containing protein n=1 Tax=Hydrocurvibacter sulfurireducens TaxID=3131937 RepID=UPI0031F95A0E
MKNKKELTEITNEVKYQLTDIDIAPPLLYKALFTNLLLKHDIKLDDEEQLINKILDERVSMINSIQENTSSNIAKLDNSTKEAISAIQNKDENRLEEVVKEMTSLRKEVEKLKKSVFTDTLTKANNRQWLYTKYINGSEHFNYGGIIVLIDMNYFKDINDNYGHIAGDKVLEFAAMHLKKTKGDLIRYGGDEFLLIFDDTLSLKNVEDIMHKNRELIMKKELKFKENSFRTSYSYGITPFKKNDNFQDILTVIDSLMYEDKEKLRHRSVLSK